MLLAVFDFETTSLNPSEAKVVEAGVILYTTTYKRILMAESFLLDHEQPISKETTEVTKIRTNMTDKFGLVPKDALSRLQNYFDMADMICGKNIIDYDIPIYKNWCASENEEPIEKPTIDIETDLPGVQKNKLAYMCADHGFLNPFPHAALADAWSSLRLIELQPDFEKVVERSKSPRVYVQALVDFDNNHLAKERKYAWAPAPDKVWFKVIKEMDVEAEAAACQFDIKRIQPIIKRG